MSEQNTEEIKQIEIPEVSQQKEEVSLEGLSDEEVSKAKEYGLVPNESKKEDKLREEQKPVDDKLKEEINVEDLDSFEKVHDLYQDHPEQFHKLPRHIKSLYHNSKGLYKRLKEEEEKRKEYEGKNDFARIQDAGAKARLERIKSRLANPENLTIEELQELLGKEEAKTDEKPLTKKDLEDIEARKADEFKKAQEQQSRIQRRVLDAEAYANVHMKELTGGKYENIDDVVALAQEVAKQKPRYLEMINKAFTDDNVTESDAVDVIVDIARLNPKWGETKKSTVTDGKDSNVDRMLKNAEKQKTSANLNGGKGGRVVTLDELTPEDAVNLTQDQWNKLPKKVRDRLLASI